MKSQKGFTLIELLIVVAIIGIIAAIAIPSLLRARVSANEATGIGDVRTVISGEVAFESAAATYGVISCLVTPSGGGCIVGYALTNPTFLDEAIGAQTAKAGYARSFFTGVNRTTSLCPVGCGIGTFCYAATPVSVGQTGVRAFGGDHSGRLCLDPDGDQMCAAGSLPTGCTVLGQ